ncbi:MAG: sugar phosphate isomerase/epimerase [Clostridiales bacterium]|nr:sugar phosphate isomerase/epimerase [Clostridiales bacterium]
MKKSIKTVTTTKVFPRGYPVDLGVPRIAALGFEGLDMGLDHCADRPDMPFMRDDCLEWAKSLRRLAERNGVCFTHSHAPGQAGDHPVIERSLKFVSELGARYMVLHPVCRDGNGDVIEDPGRFIALNAVAYRYALDKAREYGVTVLSENLLSGASRDPRIIARLAEAVGSDRFGWCLDTGHANCSGYDPGILLECTVAPMSLHINDNSGKSGDEHLVPGDGTVDWDRLVKTLKNVGYSGDCVLEAHHQSAAAPDEERDAILSRLLVKALELRSSMERK